MKYGDTIKVTYQSGRSADSGGGLLDDGSTTTVYNGSADVQDGSEALRQLAEAGLQGEGDAIVFLPEHTSVADEGIQEGHSFEWTDRSKTGVVIGITHLDDKLMVSFN